MDVLKTLIAIFIWLYIALSANCFVILTRYPSHLQTELRGSVPIMLSWNQTSAATLTVSQEIRGVQTDVLNTNGSEYTEMNNWRDKVDIDVLNCTDICRLNLTLTNVVLEDEGAYVIKVRHNDGIVAKKTAYNTARFRITTYAPPIYMNIAVDKHNVNEWSGVKVSCSGNIGRPPGDISLVQSLKNYSFTIAWMAVNDLPVSRRQMLPNGTFTVQHDFHVNMTRYDNGTNFRCRYTHYIPNFGIMDSQISAAIHVSGNISGLDFTVTPSRYVVGNTGQQTMRCTVNEQHTRVYNIKLIRVMAPGADTLELLAEFDKSNTAVLNSQIQNNKGFVVTGDFEASQPYIELTMDASKMDCSDARMYLCEGSVDLGTGVRTTSQNHTTQAFVLPTMTALSGTKNGMPLDGGSIGFKAFVDVGDQLELMCDAMIGSLNQTKIQWRKTSETTSEFIGYNPPSGNFDDGIPLSNNQCGYTRRAVIRYNVTAADANYDLAFECYVAVSGYPSSIQSPNGVYQTPSNMKYHLEVQSGVTKAPGGVSSAGSGNAGVIAGAVVGSLVFIVLIVILVYVFWYRRRSSGEDYTTKEELGSSNPNLAPQEPYASVDRSKKRGLENRGLDEPHESSRYYSNAPGKSNYGMDRDADDYDSRDGSPTMNHQGISHMGMDPMDGRIGTGV